MTRNRFIKKWLGNRDYEYSDNNRGLMLDDLDKVIDKALNMRIVGVMLPEHKCKYYVNADWTYLSCECGKRITPEKGNYCNKVRVFICCGSNKREK